MSKYKSKHPCTPNYGKTTNLHPGGSYIAQGCGHHHRLAVETSSKHGQEMGRGIENTLVRNTASLPRWPWIAIAPDAVTKLKHPAECVAHTCPRHPHKGPLYYSLSTVGKLPKELYPALRTHLREHNGNLALLVPHGLATYLPRVLAPKIKPGIWFNDLSALATLSTTIAAVDAGKTRAEMAMAGVAESELEVHLSRPNSPPPPPKWSPDKNVTK